MPPNCANAAAHSNYSSRPEVEVANRFHSQMLDSKTILNVPHYWMRIRDEEWFHLSDLGEDGSIVQHQSFVRVYLRYKQSKTNISLTA